MSAVDLARDLWLLLAALGLNLAVGYAGQPVLGQGAFVAFGAYGTLLLAAHLPLGLAVLLAVLGAAVLGWLLDFGAARLRGAFLALGTWALAWLAAATLDAFPGTFGGTQGLLHATPATLVSRPLGLAWRLTAGWHVAIAGVLCVALLLGTWALGRSAVGLDLAALREGPDAAASVGVDGAALRRTAFAWAAAFGALSGAGTALLLGVVAPSSVSPLLSIRLFVAVLVGGAANPYGPLLGTALLLVLPDNGVLTAVLLVAALALAPRLPRRARARRRAEGTGVPPTRGGAVEGRGLSKHYGGVPALDGVDIALAPGEVHALIGPNGSGKSTLLRVLAGAVPADSGRVLVDGTDVTGTDQVRRVRRGVARTFQDTVLFPGLSVADHVAVGARATEAPGAWRTLLALPSERRDRRRAAALVDQVLRDTGLPPDATPEALAYGDQRILQVARAAATGAGALLLDEPAAGMSVAETRRLTALLKTLAGNGRAVLVVEHNMRFVSAVADTVTVLAEGRVLAHGSPAAIREDEAVHEAYLGVPA